LEGSVGVVFDLLEVTVGALGLTANGAKVPPPTFSLPASPFHREMSWRLVDPIAAV
jgi:hypothetical protein